MFAVVWYPHDFQKKTTSGPTCFLWSLIRCVRHPQLSHMHLSQDLPILQVIRLIMPNLWSGVRIAKETPTYLSYTRLDFCLKSKMVSNQWSGDHDEPKMVVDYGRSDD